jgi:prophage maintenance system killer protein
VGAAAAELVVEINGHRLHADDADLAEVTFAVARGELSTEALAIWFRQRLEPVQD